MGELNRFRDQEEVLYSSVQDVVHIIKQILNDVYVASTYRGVFKRFTSKFEVITYEPLMIEGLSHEVNEFLNLEMGEFFDKLEVLKGYMADSGSEGVDQYQIKLDNWIEEVVNVLSPLREALINYNMIPGEEINEDFNRRWFSGIAEKVTKLSKELPDLLKNGYGWDSLLEAYDELDESCIKSISFEDGIFELRTKKTEVGLLVSSDLRSARAHLGKLIKEQCYVNGVLDEELAKKFYRDYDDEVTEIRKLVANAYYIWYNNYQAIVAMTKGEDFVDVMYEAYYA